MYIYELNLRFAFYKGLLYLRIITQVAYNSVIGNKRDLPWRVLKILLIQFN